MPMSKLSVNVSSFFVVCLEQSLEALAGTVMFSPDDEIPCTRNDRSSNEHCRGGRSGSDHGYVRRGHHQEDTGGGTPARHLATLGKRVPLIERRDWLPQGLPLAPAQLHE